MSINGTIFVDPELVKKIKHDLLEKSYYDEIRYNIYSKARWKIVADLTDTFAHVFTGISTILAFASGFFNYALFSFLAGCFGTISLVLLKFSSYALDESKERTNEINILLNKLGITEMPNTSVDENNITNTTSYSINVPKNSDIEEDNLKNKDEPKNSDKKEINNI